MARFRMAHDIACWEEEEGKKRQTLFSRPHSFIRLVDYLVVSTLHQLVVNAVENLLAVLQEHIDQMPSRETIESWSHLPDAAAEAPAELTPHKVGGRLWNVKGP